MEALKKYSTDSWTLEVQVNVFGYTCTTMKAVSTVAYEWWYLSSLYENKTTNTLHIQENRSKLGWHNAAILVPIHCPSHWVERINIALQGVWLIELLRSSTETWDLTSDPYTESSWLPQNLGSRILFLAHWNDKVLLHYEYTRFEIPNEHTNNTTKTSENKAKLCWLILQQSW